MKKGSNNKDFLDMPYDTEQLKVTKHSIKARINILTGKEGEFYVAYSPSLNVSGYGETEKDATDSFLHNFEVFAQSLLDLKVDKQKTELQTLGWKRKKYATKQYSKAYVDENGELRNLQNAKVRPLETAA